MAIPVIGWAIAASIGFILGKTFGGKRGPEPIWLRIRSCYEHTIFLKGEKGVGKDTILHILKDGTFVENPNATPKLHKKYFNACGRKLIVINTAGDELNDDENIKAREELDDDTKFIYVFNADDYFANEKVKKLVQSDMKVEKKQCNEKGYKLKIIGTHKDKCLENGISEAEIQKLIDELGENGRFECQILDLTRAKTQGEEVQKELCDFIIA